MKQIIIIIGLIFVFTTANAQQPFVGDLQIEEAPINLAIDSFTNIKFQIGNSAAEPMDRFTVDPLRFTLSLSKMEAGNLLDPASSVTGADWFTITYIPSIKMYYFVQKEIIPGTLNHGVQVITVNVKVTAGTTAQGTLSNGYALNVIPIGYGANNQGDDYADIATFTINEPILLPVELVRFEGFLSNCNTELTWETASELNNDYFSVQKSINSTDWEEIGRVKGNGNSDSPIIYSFTDENLNSNLAYYRLVQNDFDGESEISKIITVNGQSCVEESFKIYPNPTYDFINIELNERAKYNYVIYASNGDIVKQSDLSESTMRLFVGDLPAGPYLINLNSDSRQISQTFIVQQ